jgi:two-component system NtrC family sensor kinase
MNETARILVVEDTPETLELNATLLREAGYAVTEARCGEEAIRLATASLPDLVLLDVVLPDLSGFAVCRRLKVDPQVGRCAVLLISSSETASETQAEGLEGGADGYIARPISNRELVARVEAMLRLKRAEEVTRASRARAVGDGSGASSAASSTVWNILICWWRFQ